jgi:hypothetical protein
MSYTKRQYVIAAFEEIGLASYVFDLTNNELLSACKRLDAMMAQWNAKGIRLSYPLPSNPDSTSLDADTEVPATLLGWTAQPTPEKQFPRTLPTGAGQKAWRYDQDPFMPIPVDPLTTGGDGVLDLTS